MTLRRVSLESTQLYWIPSDWLKWVTRKGKQIGALFMRVMIFLLLFFISINGNTEEYIFGLKVTTPDGLSLKISYGDGKVMYINLEDCTSCNHLELDIQKELREINNGTIEYPLVTGLTIWEKDSGSICYRTNKNTIKINEIKLKVPKKLEGCK